MAHTVHNMKISRVGSPDVLEWTQEELPEPSPGEVRLRQEAVGVNYIDIYHRTGAYPLPLPSGIGVEGAGVIEAIGDGVTHVTRGEDLLPSTHVHRVLQALLGLPEPIYLHHRLIMDDKGVRLAKRADALAIRRFRESGWDVEDVLEDLNPREE